MDTDQDVTAHYRHGNLEQALLAAATAMGKDPTRLRRADLMGALTSSTSAAPGQPRISPPSLP